MKPLIQNTGRFRSRSTDFSGFVILGVGESSPAEINVSKIVPQGGDANITTTNLLGHELGAITQITDKTISFPVSGLFGPVTCVSGEVWVYLD